MSSFSHYPDKVNLDNCAKEPIHLIGSSQEFGVLLVCDSQSFEILQAGTNFTDVLNVQASLIPGLNLAHLLAAEQLEVLKENIHSTKKLLPQEVDIKGQKWLLVAHLSAEYLVIDIEPLSKTEDPLYFQKRLSRVLDTLQEANSEKELCEVAASLTKDIFGYDRVMIYRFDEQWNGEVVAEVKEPEQQSWLGLHYPATDIPEQSRKLFLKHRVRMIADVYYTPVPLTPEISSDKTNTNKVVDLSRSALRAVSPIHIEYLKNMDVGASLSAAIVVNGKLWGLIACHHQTAKYTDYFSRESCRFLARIFALELSMLETNRTLIQSQDAGKMRKKLFSQMRKSKSIVKALNGEDLKFTHLLQCEGGAVYFENEWELSGKTPSQEQLNSLLRNFLSEQSRSLYHTRNLSAVFEEAQSYRDTASGLLSLKIAKDKFVLWFKPEEIEVVNWGGNPNEKAFYNEKEQRISPRKSFEKWSQNLTGFSQPWQDLDLSAARAFSENVSFILLSRQHEEIEALNGQLQEANQELELFTHGLSHDLRAPVRGMEGYLTILKEDYPEFFIKEPEALLQKSLDLTERMNGLIDNILEYSRLNHLDELEVQTIDTTQLLHELLTFANVKEIFSHTQIKIAPNLPFMKGDRRMLFQLWSNLLLNALKYSDREKNPVVEVGSILRDNKEIYFISDNGIGIAADYHQKIFNVFDRAVGSSFKGSGIGLAIVKKIIEKHGGEIWVESALREGSKFYFYLHPIMEKSKEK